MAFYIVTYMLARMFLGDFSKPNSETFASIKIMMTFSQNLYILAKMEQTRTKNHNEAKMTSFFDKLLYFVNPGEWIFDFDCYLVSKDPEDYEYPGQMSEQKYLHRLLVTIFMPVMLFITNVLVIWFLTFLVKQC